MVERSTSVQNIADLAHDQDTEHQIVTGGYRLAPVFGRVAISV